MQLTEQGSEHHHPDGSQPLPAACDYKPVHQCARWSHPFMFYQISARFDFIGNVEKIITDREPFGFLIINTQTIVLFLSSDAP